MFSIPTVTTSLSGFGLWVRDYFKNPGNGISIIERTDDNENKVVSEIRQFMAMFVSLGENEVKEARSKAHEISRIAMWDSLVQHYFTAYDMALDKSAERRDEPREFLGFVEAPGVPVRKPHQVPVWKDIYVQSHVPDKLASLKELTNNLWWSWNAEAEIVIQAYGSIVVGRSET